MLISVVPPDQYDILANIADGFTPDPANSVVLIAWEDTEPIGRTMLVGMPHIEATWVAEAHRGGTAAPRLIKAIEYEAKALGLPRVLAYTVDPKHTEYMERLGWKKMDFTVLAKEF
jgi:GNAT superfamily N-acetyltransferase